MSISPRRTALVLAFFGAVPLLAACPEKKTPAFDAALPPPPPVEDAAPVLQEMPVEDAGADTGVDAAKPKYAAVNTNVARLKQCCNQLAVQGKSMGASPEGAMFTTAAAQCSAMAAQAGPTGTAPELGALRTLLAGRTIPAACAGF